MHLPLYFIPLIHCFVDSIEHLWYHQGKRSFYVECNCFTHLHTSSLTYMICIINFITFLLQLLLWSHSHRSWNNLHCNKIKSSCFVQTDSLFCNLHVCTTMHANMINYYCRCHQYFILCALQVISFIFFVDSINNFREQQDKSICFFQMNKFFVPFDSFHIFDALTFILHHYYSSFSRFHWTSLVTSR